MPSSSEDLWISLRKPRPRARLLLLCFPYAGGGALAYRDWTTAMPEDIDVLPVQLPGRERRLREPPYTEIEPLVAAATQGLAPHLDRPFAIFGHSMGAVVGYEVAHRLRRDCGLEPVHLVASAHSAPQLPPDSKENYKLPDEELIARLREINGTPIEVLEHPELMELMLPLIRADFELNDTYQSPAYPPLECPVTAFGGLGDDEITAAELEAWGDITTGRFVLRMLPGDHFFLHSERRTLIRTVADVLLRGL